MNVTLTPTAHGMLAVRRSPGVGDPLVCLHGFTLHGGMFTRVAALLDEPVLAPDLPGHGGTDVAPVDLTTTLDALVEWLGSRIGPSPVLGYSQGGRIALHLAVRHPHLVSSLVLVSASLGLSGEAMAVRRAGDEELATTIEREGLAAFLDRWLAQPLIGTGRLDRSAAAADRSLREENTAAGLAAALRGLGQGSVPAVDPHDLEVPTLWIAGSDDERYSTLAAMGAASAGGGFAVVPGAGHNLIAERPEGVARLVSDFLQRGR